MLERISDDTESPQLSVVVVIVSDTTSGRRSASHLARSLNALSQQVDPPPMEIIVPLVPPVEGLDEVMRRFPQVVFIPFSNLRSYTGLKGNREHHDELRARGLAAARGEIVALLEDHAMPDPYWCSRMVEAHSRYFPTHAAVGGAIENSVNRALNWAVYLCDFGKYQNPLPEGDTRFASDANISYKASALESVRDSWQDRFQETEVNWALTSRGEKLALSPRAIVHQNRVGLDLLSALWERFVWGRSYAASRANRFGFIHRVFYAALAPSLPIILVGRVALGVTRKRRNRWRFVQASPLLLALTTSWALGELAGYTIGHRDQDTEPATAAPTA